MTQPIVCTLTPNDLRTQGERWRTLFAEAGVARTETDDGLQIRFRRDAAIERDLRKLVAVEVECCKWATWAVEDPTDELVLKISSTGDGVPVLHSWLLEEEPDADSGSTAKSSR